MTLRKLFLCAAPLALAACTTTGVAPVNSVMLNAQRAFLTAQVGFKSLQQVALAGVTSGAITGARKNQIIDLVDRGQQAEDAGFDAEQRGFSAAQAATQLTDIVAQLHALGVGR